MPVITLETTIRSSIEICFDLSRSIDLHAISMGHTNEKAVAGTTSGLIELDETVTWRATHLGIRQKLTSKITAYNRPFYFRDEQVKGFFQSLVHDHLFEAKEDKVVMKDVFAFQSSCGIAGRLLDKLLLTKYMTQLLSERNQMIKEYAETGRWKEVLQT